MNFRERYLYDPKTDLIGKGGFSKVYKAYDSIMNRTVALKFFTSDDQKQYNHLFVKM